MHIVVFPGWYPCRMDKLSGDFIQRHMDAIAEFTQITVIFPVKDSSVSKTEEIIIDKGSLKEIYIYYPSFTRVTWLDRIFSFFCYNYLCYTKTKAIKKSGSVSLIHLYVLQKNLLMGLLAKIFLGIPYVISEQSTYYVDGRLEKKAAWFYNRIIAFVFNRAKSFHAVSKYLKTAIQSKLNVRKQHVVIPNVVDVKLFGYKEREPNQKFTFVHVSNMVAQKNVEGMIYAISLVRKSNKNFVLNLVGPVPAKIRAMIEILRLQDHVVLWNQRDYKEVAEIIQQSDVFIFFTRYETFGCVIIEANAAGLPVVVTDLEVTRELITENKTGIFVEDDEVVDLAEKLVLMMNNFSSFDKKAIAADTAAKFNYSTVGKQFFNWYQSLVR